MHGKYYILLIELIDLTFVLIIHNMIYFPNLKLYGYNQYYVILIVRMNIFFSLMNGDRVSVRHGDVHGI